ncbi:MAG: alanine racemase [Sporolactobacillus sp.]
MDTNYYRDTWAEIDLDAIAWNVAEMRARLPQNVAMMAVVKANGYGHGARQVAEIALANGASWLAVAIFDEALALRAAGIDVPILVLSPIRPQDAALAAAQHISLAVSQEEWLTSAAPFLQDSVPLRLHLACDTGMGRIGIQNREQASAFLDAVKGDSRFEVEGMFTHFATADQEDAVYFNEQYACFERMVEWVHQLGVHPAVIHCANSATTLRFPKEGRQLFNLVRYGISMYGLSPSPDMCAHLPFPLRPALSLHSCLTYVKQVPANSFIGYGATYQAAADEWIGTVPIGYADGFLRALSGTDVLVDGRRCPIVGRICMDQLMIRLPHAYPLGTAVVLIGKDGNEEISADERAAALHTINYEVTCLINARVPRVFKRDGKISDTENAVLDAMVCSEKSRT